MDIREKTIKKTRYITFVGIEMTDPAIPYPITVQGFVDNADKVFDLTYLDINANEKGKGFGRQAIKKLAEIYDRINIYQTQDQALMFWLAMYREKLVTSIHWDFDHLSMAQRRVWNTLAGGVINP